MIQTEPDFKSKELQNASPVQSSITAIKIPPIMPSDVTEQLKRYYAIRDNNAYLQFELGAFQGSKKQNNGTDIILNIFSALQTYLGNLNKNDTTIKVQTEKLLNIITSSTQLLFELATPKVEEKSTERVPDYKVEIQALLLGLLSKNL